jgi:hypothetical protein
MQRPPPPPLTHSPYFFLPGLFESNCRGVFWVSFEGCGGVSQLFGKAPSSRKKIQNLLGGVTPEAYALSMLAFCALFLDSGLRGRNLCQEIFMEESITNSTILLTWYFVIMLKCRVPGILHSSTPRLTQNGCDSRVCMSNKVSFLSTNSGAHHFGTSLFFFVALAIKFRVLHMLGKHSTTVPHPQPSPLRNTA